MLLRRCRPTPSCLAACASLPSYASPLAGQGAFAFNQPLSLNTSSVTTMQRMFYVCSARALAAASTVGSSLHAACAAAATPRPPATRPARRPSFYASLLTRQSASAFNQPLSLDTSSVTDMQYMFNVRSARALPAASIVRPSRHAVAPLPPHTFLSRGPRVAPLPMLPCRLDRVHRRSTSR